jgi:hypothetical protein
MSLVQQRNRSRQWAPEDKRGVAGLPPPPEAGLTRRSILTGIVGLLAAPAIVRISSLMPISVQPVCITFSVGGVPFSVPYYPDELTSQLADRIQGFLNRAGVPLYSSVYEGSVAIHSGLPGRVLRPIAPFMTHSIRTA